MVVDGRLICAFLSHVVVDGRFDYAFVSWMVHMGFSVKRSKSKNESNDRDPSDS